MKKFNVRLSVSSNGTEQAKVFNFTTSEDMSMLEVYNILRVLVKDSYHLRIGGFHKKHRGVALSFEQLCKTLQDWRFYETRSTSYEEVTHAWEYITSLEFPCNVYLKYFHSEWGGTFFEISFEDTQLVKPSFCKVKEHLAKYGIDLFQSKTPSLWYSHRYLELTELHSSILVRRRNTVHEWKNKTEKIEL